jgi:hypothetical protein
MSIETFNNDQAKVYYQNTLSNSLSKRCNIVHLIEKANAEKKIERKKNILFFLSFLSVVALVVTMYSLVH